MKCVLNSLMPILKIILMVADLLPTKEIFHFKKLKKKIILYLVSFFFLVSAFVFGCMALYTYLSSNWGEALSALFICLLFLIITLGLIVKIKLLGSKKNKGLSPQGSLFEKAADTILNKDLGNFLKEASPQILIAVMGVVAVSTYAMFCKKNKK